MMDILLKASFALLITVMLVFAVLGVIYFIVEIVAEIREQVRKNERTD